MALQRRKLGLVGDTGVDEDNGSRKGGIAVDLDPLSAFAMMRPPEADSETHVDAVESREHGRGTSTVTGARKVISVDNDAYWPENMIGNGGAEKREDSLGISRSEIAPSVSFDAEGGPVWGSNSGGIRSSSTNYPQSIPALAQQASAAARQAAEAAMGYFDSSRLQAPQVVPPAPSTGAATATLLPSPPRQLNALRESPHPPHRRIGSLKSATSSPGDASNPDSSAEKVDPLEVLKAEGIECLWGELLLVKLQNACVEGLHGKMVPGILVMTTYKLLMIPRRLARRSLQGRHRGRGADDRYHPFGHLPKEYLQVPMTCIDRVERDADRKSNQRADRFVNSDTAVTVHCKDARRLRISFGGPEESDRAMKMLQQLAFPGQQIEHLFAFSHRTVEPGVSDPGWHIYDPRKEFDRMGFLKPRRSSASPWRITDLNSTYALCASYPPVLVVPASVTDQEVEIVAQFRSEQRLPVLCWGRQADSASIWRSSQPKIGISRATCAEDEHMLGRLAATSPSRILPIVDCRPRSNATANFATGYGYESYSDCPLEFAGIGNIHVMRESLSKLESLCLSNTSKDQDWTALVEDTRWLSHVRTVLTAAWTVAVKAHTQRTPVLVHCSHGWDRTSQVCSLAQMLLDPYYRTIDGFQVLIEKDWLAFGHPFHLRHAYGLPRGVTSAKDDQRSPIFLQFLDCTWQLVMQLPSHFEFNPRYLLCIADHVHSCRFGTLLCNTNKVRRDVKLEERCGSLWTYLELHRQTFLSTFYHWDAQEELLPPLSSILRHVRLWGDYFLRWSPAESFMPFPPTLIKDEPAKENLDETGRHKEADRETSQIARPEQQAGEEKGELSVNDDVPAFRCEFDEMERWVLLNGDEADRWRWKAQGQEDMIDFAAGISKDSTTSAGEGSVPEVYTDLNRAREEIRRLKAVLADKDKLINEILEGSLPSESTLDAKEEDRRDRNGPSANHRASWSAGDVCTSDKGGDRVTNFRPAVRPTEANPGPVRSNSVDLTLAEDEKNASPYDIDGDDDGFRPRIRSSEAESREARRSSLSEMHVEDDHRGQTPTSSTPDVPSGDIATLHADLEHDRGRARAGAASWKWQLLQGTEAAKIPAANGPKKSPDSVGKKKTVPVQGRKNKL